MMSFPMDHQQKAVVKMIKAPSILVVSIGSRRPACSRPQIGWPTQAFGHDGADDARITPPERKTVVVGRATGEKACPGRLSSRPSRGGLREVGRKDMERTPMDRLERAESVLRVVALRCRVGVGAACVPFRDVVRMRPRGGVPRRMRGDRYCRPCLSVSAGGCRGHFRRNCRHPVR